jgi:hypothetical protein
MWKAAALNAFELQAAAKAVVTSSSSSSSSSLSPSAISSILLGVINLESTLDLRRRVSGAMIAENLGGGGESDDDSIGRVNSLSSHWRNVSWMTALYDDHGLGDNIKQGSVGPNTFHSLN